MWAGSTNPLLQVGLNSDGTIKRPPVPTRPASLCSSHVASTDVPLNPSKGTYVRLYQPAVSTSNLPLVVFFHGGGFILFGPEYSGYHDFCERVATEGPAVVASVSYRLAPESRLPAAYEDAAEALEYLRSIAAAPPLGKDHPLGCVDFSKCFLMGSSAGSNIIYHTMLSHFRQDYESSPLRIAGLALHQIGIGGEVRTASELAREDDAIIPMRFTDLVWRLSLPEGANRDHPFCNPMSQGASTAPGAAEVLARLPRCLVTGNVEDPLIDREREFARMLESAGVDVKARLDGKGGHVAELFDEEIARSLISDLREFILES